MNKKFAELAGWIGMFAIHGATLPMSFSFIFGLSNDLPPLNMVLMVWAGLLLFLIRAIAQKDTLYIVSNSVGFAANSAVMALLVL
jgi:hypothetical protein|tara:strand:+ start:4993 stop:5247 length:255 start_codon:yes stop_codon:yes gene_type:complete